MSSRRAVEVFVVPVFRRRWLWHMRPESAAAAAEAASSASTSTLSSSAATTSSSNNSWTLSRSLTLSQRLRLARKNAGSWASSKLHSQWDSIARAPPNSFKGVMHRLARAVLDREDPDAAFLRSLPVAENTNADAAAATYDDVDDDKGREQNSSPPSLRFTLFHPASLPQRLVRRRTRLLVRKGRADARRRLWGWGALTVPLLPVLLTPLPALPLYFCMWKTWTARASLRGSRALAEALDVLAEEQARAAAEAVEEAAGGGGGGGGGGAKASSPSSSSEGGRGGGQESGGGSSSSSGGGFDNLPPRGSWADAALAKPDPAGRYLDIFEEGRRGGLEREVEGESNASDGGGGGGGGGDERRRRQHSRAPRIEFVPTPEIDLARPPPPPSSPSAPSSPPPPPPPLSLSLEEAQELERRLPLPGLEEGVRRVLRSARKGEIEGASGGNPAAASEAKAKAE